MRHTCPILKRDTDVDKTDFCQDSWEIVRCQETGFVFLANPPEYSQLESEFAWEKTHFAERQRRETAEPVMTRVSSFAKNVKSFIAPKRNKIASVAFDVMQTQDHSKPLKVLDIGCGWGDLMLEVHCRFAQLGRDVLPIGIEVSKELALLSEEKIAPIGGKVICANAIDGISDLEPDSIDLALMSSFLEHECQPLQLLQRLHIVLAPNGAVVLKVPNFDCWNRLIRGRKWCGFRYPDHVNYFTPKTLQRLAHESQFAVARQNVLDKFPLSDNMYAVLAKSA